MKTKKFLFASLLMLFAIPSMAQYEISVKSVTSDDDQFVDEKFPGGWDFSLSMGSKKSSNRTVGWSLSGGGFGVGFVDALGCPEGMSVKMGQSVEFNWSDLIAVKMKFKKRNSVSLGLGLLWRNYRMTDQNRFIQNTDGTIGIEPYPTGANPNFSRLHTFSVTFPLKYRYKWGHGWHLGVGPELAITPSGNKHNRTLKTRYELNGERFKDKSYDVHVNPVTVNLVANINYKGFGFYARWSPNSVLDTNYGPNFTSMSAGFMIMGF